MARYYYSGARDTVDRAKKIELSWLKKEGYLLKDGGVTRNNINWSINGNPTGNISFTLSTAESESYINLTYRIRPHGATDDDWEDMEYRFPLEKIPCRYGGYKWYYRCQLYRNGVYCGKRARVLYEAGNYFGCRQCANLSYDSCNEGKHFRGGMFRVLSRSWKADEYHQTLKRYTYRGRPTRKYRRYLKLGGGYSEEQIMGAVGNLTRAIKG